MTTRLAAFEDLREKRGIILLLALLAVAITATFLSGAAIMTRRFRVEAARFYERARLKAVLRETGYILLRSEAPPTSGEEKTPDGIRIVWTIASRPSPTGRQGEFRGAAERGNARRECFATFCREASHLRILVWLER